MRFAAPDSDEDTPPPSSTHNAWRSPAYHSGPSRTPYTPSTHGPKKRSALGKRNQSYGYADSSDSDSEVNKALDSDEELEGMLQGGDLGNGSLAVSPSTDAWRRGGTTQRPSRKGKEKFKAAMEIIENAPNEYEAWVKITEEAAWRQGHKIAHSRRVELREIALNAKAEMKEEQSAQATQDAEDMRRMLEGLAIRQTKEEEEARRVFKEREKKLWSDIDAAIKRTEELEHAKRQLEAAARQKMAEEEHARKAAMDQAKAAAEADAQRKAREAAEKEQAAGLARVQAESAAEKRKDDESRQRKAADSRGLTGAQWKAWVMKQRQMKSDVIEPVKAAKEIRAGLRQGMRLITRGLGQVVNTRDSILRVTNDISGILNSQLPNPPSAAAPVVLSQSPPIAYSYLLSHLSKTLIKQAENEVSAKQDAAFPLGRIVIGLLLRGHAALGDVLFARMVKKCPWVVPFYPSRQTDQPRAEYEKSTGRGTDEGIADYINRMAGITTLYFAILQTSISSIVPTLPAPPTPDQLVVLIPPPLRLPAAWSWLAYSLRDPMPSLPPIAHLLGNWIEVCGYEVGRVYGLGQLGKVYEAIKKEGVAEGKLKGDSEAAKQKLGMMLEGGGQPEEPLGRNWEEYSSNY